MQKVDNKPIYDTIPTEVGEIKVKRLPKSEITMRQIDSDTLIVGAHEHMGCRFFMKVALADLPNDLIGIDDLERFGIQRRDLATVLKL
jgi:hypothetical protein